VNTGAKATVAGDSRILRRSRDSSICVIQRIPHHYLIWGRISQGGEKLQRTRFMYSIYWRLRGIFYTITRRPTYICCEEKSKYRTETTWEYVTNLKHSRTSLASSLRFWISNFEFRIWKLALWAFVLKACLLTWKKVFCQSRTKYCVYSEQMTRLSRCPKC
jgi:hypothetical protein